MSDIENVKKLREATGAGFKDCNLAIKESGGDIDKAIEILTIEIIQKFLNVFLQILEEKLTQKLLKILIQTSMKQEL